MEQHTLGENEVREISAPGDAWHSARIKLAPKAKLVLNWLLGGTTTILGGNKGCLIGGEHAPLPIPVTLVRVPNQAVVIGAEATA